MCHGLRHLLQVAFYIHRWDEVHCFAFFPSSQVNILGRDGIDLSKQFEPHPRTYLGIAVDGFPNWFSALGPNTGVGAGSLLIIIERQVDYAVAATLKLQRERLKSIEVKKKAVDDFDAYLEVQFKLRSFVIETDLKITELFSNSK